MTDTTSQTPGTTPAATVDTRMMAITHTAHRREIGLAAGLVRAVNAGDRRRVDIIAEHVTLCLALLDHPSPSKTRCSGRCFASANRQPPRCSSSARSGGTSR